MAEFIVSPQMFVGFGVIVVATLVAGLVETIQGWRDSWRR